MHTFAGLLMLVPAFGMLWLLAWMLKLPGWIKANLYIDEPPGDQGQERTEVQA